MSASNGLSSEAEEHEAWPAFVDLFSATSLLFIAFVGVFIYLLVFQQGTRETNRRAILQRLAERSVGGTLFEVDSSDRQFVRIILKERATFPQSQFEWKVLRDSGKIALDSISVVLRDTALSRLYREVRVLGHSDQDAYVRSGFSNWELSASRAAVVVRYMVTSAGMDPCKISATGLGPYYPIGKVAEANRRIEIQVVPGLRDEGGTTRGCDPRGDGTRRAAGALFRAAEELAESR